LLFQHIENDRIYLRYCILGSGKNLLFAFHGFNRHPEDFRAFERDLGNKYTIISFELFFHGESYIKEIDSPVFQRKELKEIIKKILLLHDKKEFELIAYSFGGRVALTCLEIFKERVKGVYLMAPDGLRFNPAYWFAAKTTVGRALFKKFVNNPEPLVWLFRKVLKTEILNPKAIEFYLHHLSFTSVRKKVYNVWIAYGQFDPHINTVARIIKKHKIKTYLFFGKFDVIIPVALGKEFAEKIDDSNALKVLDIGHRVMEKHEKISRIILDQS
jgi:pimeloyl-ACP methyl ester carboxylesterase